jgi:menaquinone-specific isochorismate synthase
MTNRTETTNFESISYHYGRLVSDSLPCPDVTLMDFLVQSHGQPRFYWESSRDSVAFAGAGKAIELVGWGESRFETIRHHAAELFAGAMTFDQQQPLAAPRLFGGFSFHQDFVPDNAWWDFTPAHFVLPHYQLLSIDGETWLTINANVPFGENPLELRDELRGALRAKIADLQAQADQAKRPPQSQLVQLDYPMPYETWHETITDATTRMAKGELNKVVLSRVAEARFDQRIDVLAPLRYLAQAYPETYRFLFEARPFHAFYGATPELLVGVNGHQMETMALAGSIRRGQTPEADNAYADELLHSKKDRYEHQLVVDTLHDRLTPLTENLQMGETDIMRLSNIQHIHTPITGTLKSNDGVLPLVEALHPTPALGGDPREIAMKLINDYEPVPRGWYAAPIGWIDGDMDGQFGVAIRSAVAQDRRVWMYAGAGIVAASDPQKEWDETGLKFRPMVNALGLSE